jgi:hypothetical protein
MWFSGFGVAKVWKSSIVSGTSTDFAIAIRCRTAL